MSDPAARAIADDAFVVLAQGLRPFVEARFRLTYGDDWKQRAGFASAVGIGSAIRSLDDPGELLAQLWDRRLWEGVFRAGLVASTDAYATHELVAVLRGLRNDLYHHNRFEVSDAWRVVDTTRRLLRAVDGLDIDRGARLDALEVRAGILAAADRLPDLERLRAEYRESVLANTTYLELGGISPSVGTRVVRVRAGDVYIAPHLTEESPREPAPAASNWMLEGEELRSLTWEERHALRREQKSAVDLILAAAEDAGTPMSAARDARAERADDGHSFALGFTRVAIVGPPGSGKSSYLRFVARGAVLGTLEALRGRTPILVRVSRLAEALAAEPGLGLRRFILHRHTERFGELLRLELELGRALVLVDGIDEVASEADRSRVLGAIVTFCADHPSINVMVTGRPVGFRPTALGPGFAVCDIEPLDDSEIGELCRRWLAVLRDEGEASSADAFAADLVAEIGRVSGVRELATNPLLLTIIVLLWERGARLPERRIDLYATATETLLRDWPFRRLGESLDAALLLSLLEPVAHRIVTTGAESIGEVELVEQLSASLGRLNGGAPHEVRERVLQILDLIESHTGFFVEVGRTDGARRFGFIHRTFAEYLAARHLAELWGSQELDLSAYLHQPAFAETIRLFFAHVGTWGPGQASRALAELMSLEWPAESSVHKNLRLALRVLEDGLRVKADARVAALDRAISAALETPDDRIWKALLSAVRSLGPGTGQTAGAERLRPRPEDPPVVAARRATLAVARDPSSDARLTEAITAIRRLDETAGFVWANLLGLIDEESTSDDRAAIIVAGRFRRTVSTEGFDRLARAGVPVHSAEEIAERPGSDPVLAPFLVSTAAQDLSVSTLVAVVGRLGARFAGDLDFGANWGDEHAADIRLLASNPPDLPPELASYVTDHAFDYSGVDGATAWAMVFWAMVRNGGPEQRIGCLGALDEYRGADVDKVQLQIIKELSEDRDARVRLSVVAAAVDSYDPEGQVSLLEEMIRSDSHPRVRTAARRCLVAIRPDPGSVYGMLSDDEAHLPAELTDDSGVDVSRRIVDGLLALDEDADTGEREALAKFLRRLMSEAPAPEANFRAGDDWWRPDPPSLGEVARSLLRAERPETRAWAGYVLGEVLRGEARAELGRLLVDEEPGVRLTAACAIQPVDVESTGWLESVLPRLLELGPEESIWPLATTVRTRVSQDGRRALLDLAEIFLAEHPLHPMGVHFVDQLLA